MLLSDVDGVYDGDPRTGPAQLIDTVRDAADLAAVTLGSAKRNGVGTGGMATKVEAALIAAQAGVPVVVTSTAQAAAALAGEQVGTLFTPTGRRPGARQFWLRYASRPRGRLILDEGAVRAVRERHASLLAAGITGAVRRLPRRRPGRAGRARRRGRRARPGRLRRPGAARRCSAARPATSRRSTAARSCTATRWCWSGARTDGLRDCAA